MQNLYRTHAVRMIGVTACLLFLFHKLRDLHPMVIYVQFILLAAVFALLVGLDRVSPRPLLVTTSCALVFVYVLLLSLGHAAYYGNPIIGLARYFFCFALVVLFAGAWFTEAAFQTVQKVLIAFSVLCALSILYQCVWGPISWFVDTGERAGAVRYSSLAGSLTIYGSIVGPALFLVLRRPATATMLGAQILLLAGAFFSYQKAALLSSALAYTCAYLLKRRKLRLKSAAVAVALGAVLVTLLFVLMNSNTSIQLFVKGAFGLLEAEEMSDVTIAQSIYDRTVDLPMTCVQFFSDSNLWLGVGVFGAGGATGYDDIPMPHNLVVEILLIHGYLVGAILCLLLLALLFKATHACCSSFSRDSLKTASGMYILTLAAALGAGSVYFHPVVGCFLWSSVFMFVRKESGMEKTGRREAPIGNETLPSPSVCPD